MNGTLFLDEIGELPLQAQVRFLRVLQDKVIERVGGTKSIHLDLRIIAATNKNLEEMIGRQEFREDLCFRLNVFPIYIKPLRERKIDIPPLVEYLVEKKAAELKLSRTPEILPEAVELLVRNDWPGNVRELQNVIERELIINPLGPLDFMSFRLFSRIAPEPAADKISGSVSGDDLDAVVKNHIEKVLNMTGGQIHGEGGAAEILGINPSTLRNRMEKLGVRYKKGE